MVNFWLNKLNFIAKITQIHGHMGLKMVHKNKARKDIKYSRLSAINILLTLSFEWEVPSRVCGFPDLNYLRCKGHRDQPTG
jgi:hypothetical protein